MGAAQSWRGRGRQRAAVSALTGGLLIVIHAIELRTSTRSSDGFGHGDGHGVWLPGVVMCGSPTAAGASVDRRVAGRPRLRCPNLRPPRHDPASHLTPHTGLVRPPG